MASGPESGLVRPAVGLFCGEPLPHERARYPQRARRGHVEADLVGRVARAALVEQTELTGVELGEVGVGGAVVADQAVGGRRPRGALVGGVADLHQLAVGRVRRRREDHGVAGRALIRLAQSERRALDLRGDQAGNHCGGGDRGAAVGAHRAGAVVGAAADLVAGRQVDAAARQFGHRDLARLDRARHVRVGGGARLPGGAVVVAVEDARVPRRGVGVLVGADDQTAGVRALGQLHAVRGAGGEPAVVGAGERGQRLGRAPAHPVVVAPLHPGQPQAGGRLLVGGGQEEHRTGLAVHHGRRIAPGEGLGAVGGAALQDHMGRTPGAAVVGGAAHHQIDVAAIGAGRGLAPLREREQAARLRLHQGRDAVAAVTAHTGAEQHLLGADEGARGRQRAARVRHGRGEEEGDGRDREGEQPGDGPGGRRSAPCDASAARCRWVVRGERHGDHGDDRQVPDSTNTW